ncbi:hypothetical protein N9993_01605 [bacterium]|jgi:DNA-directed RNA polymerase subunit M/transcription elongation factor TFIIS|nr:hypothetical protein [bacterium]
MLVDLDDVAFWMDAIRNNENHYGVLESFWKGQLKSKVWLVEHLYNSHLRQENIVIFGGWNGVLSSLLFNSKLEINDIRSVDIDPSCEEVANMICKRQEIDGKFNAVTCDMCTYEYEYTPDLVINTSTEHITQEQYNTWLERVPQGTAIAIQNNNYVDIPDHIRCYNTIEEFESTSGLSKVYTRDTLELPLYNRFLLIGRK